MCWFSMAKLFMFVFNFALFGAGAATLGIGVWISSSTNGDLELLGITISENGAFVLVAAGSVAMVMGFLGCCGAKEESTGLLGLYFLLLLIIVVLQLAVGIWAAVQFDSIDEVVNKSLNALDLTKEENVATMNNIGKEFQCCGRNGTCEEIAKYSDLVCDCDPKDYTSESVCKSSDCGDIYAQGCNEAITNFVNENMRIIAGIGIGIGLIEILGLIFSICMCQAIKESKGYA